MEEIFKNVDKEKKERIVNSSFEEFSKNGFDKASTNEIVKKAQVSKGILFHYFGNKQSLYDKLTKYALNLINDSLENNINWEERDFFLRLKKVAIIKASMTNRYPYIYEFLKVVFREKSNEEIQAITNNYTQELVQKVYSYNIDFTLFKEDIDIKVTMNIIRWTLENLGKELWHEVVEKGDALDEQVLSEQSDQYIKALRTAFYKKKEWEE